MIALILASLLTTTNRVFVTLPDWAPTNATPDCICYGNVTDGVRVGPEYSRLGVTNAAAFFSAVDGYYERAVLVPGHDQGSGLNGIYYGNAVVPVPGAGNTSTNLWAIPVEDWHRVPSEYLPVGPDAKLLPMIPEWDKGPRAVTNTLRLSGAYDAPVVARRLAHSQVVTNRPWSPPLTSRDGELINFSSPDLEHACRALPTDLPIPQSVTYEWNGTTGDAFFPFRTPGHFPYQEWSNVWPNWSLVAPGDAVFRSSGEPPEPFEGGWRSAWLWIINELASNSRMIQSDAYGRMPGVDTLNAAYSGGVTSQPLVGGGGSPLTLTDVFRRKHAGAPDGRVAEIADHYTNDTLRLDRERQGVINWLESACRQTYRTRLTSGWTGTYHRVELNGGMYVLGDLILELDDQYVPTYTIVSNALHAYPYLDSMTTVVERAMSSAYPVHAVQIDDEAGASIDCKRDLGAVGLDYDTVVRVCSEFYGSEPTRPPFDRSGEWAYEFRSQVFVAPGGSSFFVYGTRTVPVYETEPAEEWDMRGYWPGDMFWSPPNTIAIDYFDSRLGWFTLGGEDMHTTGQSYPTDWGLVPHTNLWNNGFVRSAMGTYVYAVCAAALGFDTRSNVADAAATHHPYMSGFGQEGILFTDYPWTTFDSFKEFKELEGQLICQQLANVARDEVAALGRPDDLAGLDADKWASEALWLSDHHVKSGDLSISFSVSHEFDDSLVDVVIRMVPYGQSHWDVTASWNDTSGCHTNWIYSGVPWQVGSASIDVSAYYLPDLRSDCLLDDTELRCRADAHVTECVITDWKFRNLSEQ